MQPVTAMSVVAKAAWPIRLGSKATAERVKKPHQPPPTLQPNLKHWNNKFHQKTRAVVLTTANIQPKSFSQSIGFPEMEYQT
jgi:hypothetical protein